MSANPEASLPVQLKNAAALEGAYRFLNNKYVNMNKLLAPSIRHTLQAAEKKIVLWVNDQTELDYTYHNAKTGLGPIGNDKGKGLLMHSTLGVDAETKEVLGIGHVQVYLRQESRKPRPKWTRTPEGLAWEVAANAIGKAPEDSIWVHVSDAGSDYFPYMASCVDLGKEFLVRVSRNRILDWEAGTPEAEQDEARKLIDYARSLSPQVGSENVVDVPAKKSQPARQAQVVMAWAKVTLSPSSQAPEDERKHIPITAWVLRIWEIGVPDAVEALEWILLSSLPVANLEEARCRATWYACRWLCEDFHQCLKTGCRVEHSQLDQRLDLERLLGFAIPIAVHLLQLRQTAHQAPQTLAIQVVDPLMVEVLARRQKLSSQTMTLYMFWRLVAQLGGFLGRKGDGNPGWRALWHGWRYLSDLTDGARLYAFGEPRT
jgi:hypothetical protein